MTEQPTPSTTSRTDAFGQIVHRSHAGGAHRTRLSTTSKLAAGVVVAVLSLTGATVAMGSATAAPRPRPDDLQLGSWVRSCSPTNPATRIDYFTDHGEHGRADVGTGPGGTRSGIFLHRDGRGGETTTAVVHCAHRPRPNRPITFRVPGPGFNREIEHDL